ncbi:MAG: 7-cyano-7-deazaguanine synthase QueC [Anaerolineae bacterium]
MIDCITIVSGGMDSVTLLHHLVKRERRTPAVITFLYGQKHAREVELAQYNADLLACQPHRILDLSPFKTIFEASALVSEHIDIPQMASVQGDPQPATYVPNRNMIFLSLAAAYAETLGVTEVFYGAQRHDMYGYWDTTPQFLEQVNAVFALNRRTPVRIQAPFVNHSKADILRTGLELGVDYSKTWSCYKGQDAACGECPTCAERLAAFAEVGIADPLPYKERNV